MQSSDAPCHGVRIMKLKPKFLLILSAATATAQDGVLDLTDLHNYANQAVPAYIDKDNTPVDNPITDIGATLGRVLFYDTRLSRDSSISCASCHQQEHAFGDTAVASTGVAGTTGRHSMRLVNARFAREDNFFWDERAPTLEAQTTQPIQDHIEMGFSGTMGDPDFADLVTRLQAIEEYKVLYTATYGDPSITEERTQQAIAQFVRSIQSFDSRFDEGLADAPNIAAPFNNYTAEENQGKQLFLAPPPNGGAGCAGCHQGEEFDIDPNSRNNGVITAIGGGTDLTNTRSPSLRDLVGPDGSSNGAFMHDGSLPSLRAVIDHYDAIPGVNANLDRRLSPRGMPQRLNLTEAEKDALEAFLRTLTGNDIYANEKWSNPFNENGELDYIVLGANSTINIDTGIMTLTATGVPHVTYKLHASDDLGTWSNGIDVTADASGQLSHSISLGETDAQFYIYSYTPSTNE